jgi:hypothetical protein
MPGEVTVTMPMVLTADMLRSVRDHDTTKTEDRDEWHRRLGWLLCAWDVLLEHRRMPASEPPSLMPVILWLEKGCDPFEAAKELRHYEAVMRPKTPNARAAAGPTAQGNT